MVIVSDREISLGLLLTNYVLVKNLVDFRGNGQFGVLTLRTRFLNFFPMMSLHRSTHSSQMKTDGPAIAYALRSGSYRKTSNTAVFRYRLRCSRLS